MLVCFSLAGTYPDGNKSSIYTLDLFTEGISLESYSSGFYGNLCMSKPTLFLFYDVFIFTVCCFLRQIDLKSI